ncbi:MAG: cell division protein ZapA [Pseudomonadota bacterium]
MPHVVVNINGKPYRMACDEGQETHLQALGERLDGYVTSLKGSVGEIGDQRLTVMAGVMATDALVEAEQRIAKMEAEVKDLRAQVEAQSATSVEANSETISQLNDATKAVNKIADRLKARPAE